MEYLKKELKIVLDHINTQTALQTYQQRIYYRLGLSCYQRAKQALNEEEDKSKYLQSMHTSTILHFVNMAAESVEHLNESLNIIKASGGKWKDTIAENDVWNCMGMVHKTRKEYPLSVDSFAMYFDSALL